MLLILTCNSFIVFSELTNIYTFKFSVLMSNKVNITRYNPYEQTHMMSLIIFKNAKKGILRLRSFKTAELEH